jgi:hypothetical protein
MQDSIQMDSSGNALKGVHFNAITRETSLEEVLELLEMEQSGVSVSGFGVFLVILRSFSRI